MKEAKYLKKNINKLEVSLLAYVWALFKLYSIIVVSFLLVFICFSPDFYQFYYCVNI